MIPSHHYVCKYTYLLHWLRGKVIKTEKCKNYHLKTKSSLVFSTNKSTSRRDSFLPITLPWHEWSIHKISFFFGFCEWERQQKPLVSKPHLRNAYIYHSHQSFSQQILKLGRKLMISIINIIYFYFSFAITCTSFISSILSAWYWQ